MAAEGIARVGPGGAMAWGEDAPVMAGAGAPAWPEPVPGAACDAAGLYDPAALSRLGAALDAALADPEVEAVVLDLAAAAGAEAAVEGIDAGIDAGIDTAGLLVAEAGYAALAAQIAVAPKPVVALITGPVAGPLAALALAAGLRVASPAGRMGFPEAGLGLVAGAGATQRAARLAGAGPALAALLQGRLMAAAEAQAAGLIEMVTEAAAPAARAAAAALAAARRGGGPVPFARDPARGLGDAAGFLAAVAAARAEMDGALPAPRQVVDCVEAALLLPEAGGLDFERAVFETLAGAPEAQALCALAAAEAAAWRAAAGAPLPGAVAFAGAGGEGPALVAGLLEGGVPVRLLGPDVAALRSLLEAIAALQETEVAAGRMTEEARDAAWDRLSATTDTATLDACSIGIGAGEAAVETLAGALPQGATLAALSWRGQDGSRPMIALRVLEVAGGHSLLELGTAGAAGPGLGLARALGMVPVPCRPGSDDLPSARLQAALHHAAEDLLLQGATPGAVDAGLRGFGFARGPFETVDAAGLDSFAARRPGIAAQLVAAGRTGRQRGRGFLLWRDGVERGGDDPDVLALIAEERQAQGLVATSGPGAVEIARLCLAALANEGARMLAAGVVARAGDVDLLAGPALGFPRHRGGPMHWAGASGGRTGLLPMRNALRAQAAALPPPMAEFWTPDPAWDRLIREGKRF